MHKFIERLSHTQVRVALVVVGLIFVAAGSVLLHLYYGAEESKKFHLNAGLLLAAIGIIIITLELAGLRRLLRMAFGFAVLILGLFLALPGVPGPGTVFILIGLAVLASDFRWARSSLHRLSDLYRRVVHHKSQGQDCGR